MIEWISLDIDVAIDCSVERESMFWFCRNWSGIKVKLPSDINK